MEEHVLSEPEAVAETVFADAVISSEKVFNVPVVGKPEQSFIHVPGKRFIHTLPGTCCVVQVLGLVERSDLNNGVAAVYHGLGCAGGIQSGSRECQSRQKVEQSMGKASIEH